MDTKIETFNLCLGLKSKKLMVEQIIQSNKIKVLCMQEVEIESGLDHSILNIKGFDLEVETNSVKSRTGISNGLLCFILLVFTLLF